MSHLDLGDIIAWLARDDGGDDVEAHLMDCDVCTHTAERLAAVTEPLRRMLPLVVDQRGLDALRRRGLVIVESEIAPEVDSTVVFAHGVDLLVHRLTLDLRQAERVDVRVGWVTSQRTAIVVHAVPFDASANALLMVCQRHFMELPPDTLMEVTVHTPRGARVTRYPIMHLLEA